MTKIYRTLAVATLLVCHSFFCCTSEAQQGLIPRKALFEAQKDEYRIQLAPDASRIYYQKRSSQEGTLFYRNTNRPGEEHAITFEGALAGWQLCPAGGILAHINTGKNKLFFLDSNLQQKTISVPPFRQLNFMATSPLYPNSFLLDLVSETDSLSGMYLLDTETDSLLRKGPRPPYQSVYFDHNFQPRAARHPNDMGGFSIFRNNGEKWIESRAYPFDVTQFIGGFQDVVSVSADGQTIYITDNLNTDKTVLLALDTQSGKTRLIASDGKTDLLPLGVMISQQGEPLMAFGVFGDARRHYTSEEVERDFNYVNHLLEGFAGYMQSSRDDQKWLLRKLNGGPITYYLFDRTTRKLTKLFNDLPELTEQYPVAPRSTHSLLARDGLELPVQVYLPPGADANGDGIPERPLPTILYVHGGPWVGVVHWNQWFHNRNFQLLANRGYAVINTEFRSSTGMGKAFTDAGDLQWGANMLHDKLDIAQWAVDMGIAREDKLAMWGWSYGGYATAAALAFAPEVFACGVAMYSPMDMDAFARIPFTDNELWRSRVGNPNTVEGTALLQSHSPQHHIKQIKRPMLLTTGSRDDRIPQKQMDDFAEALAENDQQPIYFYYPEEGHDYRDPGSWISFWGITEQFLHQHLGGRFEPIGEDLKEGNFEIVYGKEFVDNLD
jgi:acetyl esterase/lipase